MQVIFNNKDRCVLRFDRGEEVVSGLIKFAQTHKISGATFTALGACESVELAFYNLEKKEYQKRPFSEALEVLSVVGNIARQEDNPIVHAHGTFSRPDFSCIGGHIVWFTAAGTVEIHLNWTEEKLTRKFNEDTGLNLLK